MNRYYGIFATLVVSLLFSIACVAANSEQNPSKIRWQYTQSADAPDGLALGHLVDLVDHQLAKSRVAAVDFLIYTLDLPDNEVTRAQMDVVVDLLHNTGEQMRRDRLASEIQNYCAPGSESWSNDEIFARMDRQDDLYVQIAQAHYDAAIPQLDPSTRQLVIDRVAKQKESSFFISSDHKDAWEEAEGPNPDMRSIVSKICQNLRADELQSQ